MCHIPRAGMETLRKDESWEEGSWMDGEVVLVEIRQRLPFLMVATPARLPFFRPILSGTYIGCFLKFRLKTVRIILNLD